MYIYYQIVKGYTEGAAPPAYNPAGAQQTVQIVQQPPQTMQHPQTQPVQYVQQPTPQQQVIYVQQQPQPQPVQHQHVVVHNPKYMPRGPTTAMCVKCQQTVQTQTRLEDGCGTWLICGGICLAGFWCGCCLIPFCLDDCKDVIHTCPRCGNYIGSRKLVNM